METTCNCQYCKMNISEETRDEMRMTFMAETLALSIPHLKGFVDTPGSRNCAADLIALFDLSEEWDIEDFDDDESHLVVDNFAYCFDKPFDFYHALRLLTNLRNFIIEALHRDTGLASTPILSKVITPAILLKYFKTRDFPQEIMDIIEKAESAEQHATVQ